MVHLFEGIFEVLGDVFHRNVQVLVVLLVEYLLVVQRVLRQVNLQVQLLVLLQEVEEDLLVPISLSLDHEGALDEFSQVLHLLDDLFGKEGELDQIVVESLLVGEIISFLINVCDLSDPITNGERGQPRQPLKGLLDFAVGPCKDLEFLGLDQELVPCQLSQKSLQIISSLNDELHILISLERSIKWRSTIAFLGGILGM